EVGGLGKGEQLHSALLMGDRGYAVTFRQIDPFYVLDLSDPYDPRVTGELKIPGVSTYLHSVGEHHVLGVGQDATDEGFTTGLKLSLFDVSDPTDPREVDVWTMRDANSPVEWDHRAFQMWQDTAIVPVQSWAGDFNGAILFDLEDGIVETGRVTHAKGGVPTSDCRELTLDDVPEENEFWWMIQDGYGHVQLCDAEDSGGWGSWYCDVIPMPDLQYWYGDPAIAEELAERLGTNDDDRIEMCWPDGGYEEAIQRSLVIDDTLWTMTPGTLQANELDGLDRLTTISLR
ncbi:MAG: hypothetical protein HKN41_09540, partial [Ilumatobacter sp.]|nr:hypothetical protein [Ilumatobacter sp.]